MSSVGGKNKGPAYWRSLAERGDTPEFRRNAEREFLQLLPESMSSATRRRFLKLMTASMALAGTGCGMDPDWPRYRESKILPYAFRPPGTKPGTPVHFATAMELSGVAVPVLAKSYDGRPIKIEGNPEHPASRGAAGALAQAGILEMYDPDRSRGVCRTQGGSVTESSWDVFLQETEPVLSGLRGHGAKLAVLAEASSSPTLAEARDAFMQAFPGARWFEWEALTRDADREASRSLFQRVLRTHHHFESADVIVSLEDDFLLTHPNALVHAPAFAFRRRPDAGLNRLYVLESAFSLTGSQADHRRALPSGGIPRAAWALAARLVLEEHVALPPDMAYLMPRLQKAAAHGEHFPFVARMAKDLAAHAGHGLITCGPSQPAGVHALVHVMNAALGNAGRTVTYTAAPDGDRPDHAAAILELSDRLRTGRIDALVILGGNPVYDAPADAAFAEALGRAGTSVHLGLHRNETSRACTWHVPRAHYLESWSDARSWDGTYTLTQPLLLPLFGGKTPAEFLSLVTDGQGAEGHDLVRSTFDARVGGGETAWKTAVHDGFVRDSAWPEVDVSFARASWKPSDADFAWNAPAGSKTEVTFLPDPSVHDGRFANNAWLQEMPDPMSKIAWDNAFLVNPVTARAMGIAQGDMIRVSKADYALEAPAYLMPGQAVGSVAIALGYGRTDGGSVASPANATEEGGGFDAYPFRTSHTLWSVPGAEIARTGGSYEIAATQEHHAIFNAKQGEGEAERLPELYREGTLAEYERHPDFAKHRVHHPPLESLWKEHEYNDRRWGMTIDLGACTGCGACVIACQAENNTSIVGKKEVGYGREMAWIRVDRYFTGSMEQPRALHQPVTCHQCENAPCEQVCPVAATVHSSEGLNDMVYNRCVGTRYCLNNCPYKVRRFNWFNHTDNRYNSSDLFKMVRNPEVTVRARGVMEKCTYCVQRIKAVTIPAKNEGRPLRDGEIVPACVQTCPSRAIAFGDLNDPESRVRKNQDDDLGYAMLEELNVKPRTHYLAKVTNPADEGGNRDGGDHAAAEHREGGRG